MAERYIEYVPVDDLQPAPLNPKAHHIDVLDESMERFGYTDPIELDERSGRLVSGHGRVEALQRRRQEGKAAPEGVRVDGDRWLVPVVRGWASTDDDEAAAYLVGANRSTEIGGWHDSELAALLETVAASPSGLAGVGYSDDDLEQLLVHVREHDRQLPGDVDPDDVPEPPAEPITKMGDLWLLGPHRLVAGDATDAEVIRKAMGGGVADVLLTDPPYGINVDTDYSKILGGRNADPQMVGRGRTYAPVVGDDEAFDASVLRASLVGTKEQFWFGANYYRPSLSADPMDGSWIVWDKRSDATDDVVGSGFELVWSAKRHQQRILRHYWCGAYGAPEARERMHPTQKPVALLVDILERWAPSPALVLDPYAGSGSVLIAAHMLGCSAVLVEISPVYCDVVCARWQRSAGEKPILESTGEPFDFLADSVA